MPACHAGDRRFESGRVRHPSRIYLRPVRPPGRGVLLFRACGERLSRLDDAGRVGPCARALTGLQARSLAVLGSALPASPGRDERSRSLRSRGAASAARRRARLPLAQFAPVKRLPLVTVLALLAVTVAISVGLAAGSPGASPSPSRGRVAQQPSPSPAAPSETSAPPSAAPPTVPPTATPPQLAAVPIVPGDPVPDDRRDGPRARRSPRSSPGRARPTTRSSSSTRTPTRSSPRSAPSGRPPAIHTSSSQRTRRPSRRTSPKNRKHLAFLRAGQVGPSVRALGWGDASLFGEGHVKQTADWPLTAQLPVDGSATADAQPFDASKVWTLVAGGDILLDRGVAQTVKVKKKGVDFPFDGGTADITGHTCCSAFGWEVPADEADRRRRRDARPAPERRPRDRELREPGPRLVPLPHLGHGLLGRSQAHQGPRQRRHRLGVAREQPHRRRRPQRHPPDDRQPRRRTASSRAARARTRRPPAGRRSSTRAARRSGSSPTTRSPPAIGRARRSRAAPRSRSRT